MDLEYKPTVDNITLTKELDEIVTASIKWILEKDLPAMKQMTRLQFWFRKAYDQGKIDSIKTATAEELMANELVSQLVERLRRETRNGMNHFDDCAVFFEDADGFDIDANESEICNCGAAWEYNQSLEALKKFEVKK